MLLRAAALMGMALMATACQPNHTAEQPDQQRLMWRESWELIAALDGRTVFDARLTVGNTGVLRGQGRLQLNVWEPDQSPIIFQKHDGPLSVGRDAHLSKLTIDIDGFRRDDQGWVFRVADNNINTLINLSTGDTPPPAPATWTDRSWEVQALTTTGDISGWITAGERGGGLTNGRGVLLRRHGYQPPSPRLSTYVLSQRLQIIADLYDGQGLWWASVDGTPLPTEDAAMTINDNGTITLSIDGHTVTVRRRRIGGISNPVQHLLMPEQWLAMPLTRNARRHVHLARARATIHGEQIVATAIIVEHASESQLTSAPSPRQSPEM